QHLRLRSELQYPAPHLARLRDAQAQDQAAADLLLDPGRAVPLALADPARLPRAEADRHLGRARPLLDPERLPHVLLEVEAARARAGLRRHRDAPDPVDGEVAPRLPALVPGRDVPVPAVVEDVVRLDAPVGGAAAREALVADERAAAPAQGEEQVAEDGGVRR